MAAHRKGSRQASRDSTCSMMPAQGATKKKAMLATRKRHTRSMCRGLTMPAISRASSTSILMTLAGRAMGSRAEIPSDTRQMPKMMASSAMMFIWINSQCKKSRL